MKILVIGGTGYVGLRERPLERDGQECGRLAFF
jgi:hypothetical protein